ALSHCLSFDPQCDTQDLHSFPTRRSSDLEAIAKNTGAMIVSNFEIANHYEEKGIEVHPMNHGGSWKFEFGKVKYVIAHHTSSFRSEEHTSELQSRENLVCRLLLEKKKRKL